MLFLSSRARRNIHTSVSFLTTRVKKTDEYDWGKLKRALTYLNGTRRLKLTLTIDSMGVIKWFIDGSHRHVDDLMMSCKDNFELTKF